MNKKTFSFIIVLTYFFLLLSCTNQKISGEKLEKTNLLGSKIHWHGRVEYKEKEELMYFYFTASGLEVQFIGTYLEIEFYASNTKNENQKPYFTCALDDEVLPDGRVLRINEENSKIKVVEGLENTKHKVTILKMSEPYDGYTAIKSIITDGKFHDVEKQDSLRFQIIGASGISGHGALGKPNEGRTTKNSSSLHGFGFLTARMFGAETQFISNSGCGLVWGARYEGIQKIYDYVGLAPDQKSTIQVRWDHTSWIPDIVIVNIGGNDYTSHVQLLTGTENANARKLFSKAVVEFLEYIHNLYPNVKIIWTHTGSNNGADANTAIIDAGLKYVRVVKIPQVASNGDPSGANNHNSLITHIKTAQILADEINLWLGIEPIYENLKLI